MSQSTDHQFVDQARDGSPDRPACPPWCVYEPDHDYESVTADGTLYRDHSSAPRTIVASPSPDERGKRDTVSVSISSEETRFLDGTVRLSKPGIYLGAENVTLTRADAVAVLKAIQATLDDMKRFEHC